MVQQPGYVYDHCFQHLVKLKLDLFAALPNQLSHPKGKNSLQQMVAVLGSPNEMVHNLEYCMTVLAIIHADAL